MTNATQTANSKLVRGTAQFFIDGFTQAIKEARKHTDSTDKTMFDTNANKRIRKYNLAINLLRQIPANIRLEAEATKFAGAYNIGTLGECIIKAVADDFKQGEYKKAIHGADIVIGRTRYEIKLSLSSYCICTALRADDNGKYRPTILINGDGIWRIKADEVEDYLTDTGALPWHGECGKPYKRFTRALYKTEDDE